MKAQIKIIDYSEKAIAVFGETKEIKDKFKIDGKYIGKYNKYLNFFDENTQEPTKQAGWIFSKKHKELVETIINEYLSEYQSKIQDVFVNDIQQTETKEEIEQQPLF